MFLSLAEAVPISVVSSYSDFIESHTTVELLGKHTTSDGTSHLQAWEFHGY
jgi:hypothetical protein